jgi:hypothetical protein
MVLPVAIPLAIIGLLAIIAYETGVTLQAMYVRDAVLKTKETDVKIQESQDQTINDIMNNPSLTPEQKSNALKTYLGLQEKKIEDTLTEMLPWILATIVVILIVVVYFTKKR